MENTDWFKHATLAFIFTHGYLIARSLVVHRLIENLLARLLHYIRPDYNRLTAFFLFSSILLSALIPNMVTVITILPLLRLITGRVKESDAPHAASLEASLLTALIYGANIGGLLSLVGSPANALLLANLEYYEVAGREQISFASWFLFSVPTVGIFGALGWLTLRIFHRADSNVVYDIRLDHPEKVNHLFTFSFSALFAFWIIFSGIQEFYRSTSLDLFGLAVGLAGTLFFFVPFKAAGQKAILKPADLWGFLEKKSVVYLGLMGGLAALVYISGLPAWLSGFLNENLPVFKEQPLLVWLFLFGLLVTFATEVLSNTAVVVAVFPLAAAVGAAEAHPVLPLFAAVSMSSTCAFMSPVATPVNALALGDLHRQGYVRNIMLPGLFLNTSGALWLAVALNYIFPAVMA